LPNRERHFISPQLRDGQDAEEKGKSAKEPGIIARKKSVKKLLLERKEQE
jgi:hypothetical protein